MSGRIGPTCGACGGYHSLGSCPLAPRPVDAADAAKLRLLSQVALEAIRVAHAKPLDERCSDCGAGGMGALRDALTKALGPGYTKLVWGNDMNVDSEAWDAALEKQSREVGK